MVSFILLVLGSLIHGGCNPPPSSACPQTPTECVQAAGCAWNTGSDGQCRNDSETGSCSGLGQGACTSATGCQWVPGGNYYSCTQPSDEVCILKSETQCKAQGSGCSWVDASSACSPPQQAECAYLSQTECDAEGSGCYYSNSVGYCDSPDDCDGLSPQNCEDKAGCIDRRSICQLINNGGCHDYDSSDECESHNQCEFYTYDTRCVPDETLIGADPCGAFYGNKGDCENTPGCNWEVDGECYPKYGYCQYVSGACTPAGLCEPQTSVFSCVTDSSLLCQGNTQNTGCSAISATAGCIWKPPQGFCIPDYGITCELENGGGGCTTGSNAGCRYTSSSAYCDRSYNNMDCDANTGNTACDTASAAQGCIWEGESYPTGCYGGGGGGGNDDECYRNLESTNCDTASLAAGCTWHASTSPSCQGDNGITCAADGGACSAASISFGCVWTPDNSASAVVSVPALMSLFILLVLYIQ